MVPEKEAVEAEKKIHGLIGITTKDNAVAQMEGLLSYFIDLAGAFPIEARQIDPRFWSHFAVYGGAALKQHVETELTARLHEMTIHPDWQYESVEHPRKCGYSNSPDGNGWVDNNEKDRGVTRYDNTEWHHFRRLKSDAAKDDIDLSSLPAPRPVKMKKREFVGLLETRVKQMTNVSDLQMWNPDKAFIYNTVEELTELSWGPGVYAIANDEALWKQAQEFTSKIHRAEDFLVDSDGGLPCVFAYDDETTNGVKYRIFVSIATKKTFVCACRKDGTWQNWEEWSDYLELPISIDRLVQSLHRLQP
jgi:hypothetical protein